MPNGNIHKTAGAFAGSITYLIILNNSQEKEKVDFGELVLSTVVGTGSARIPDFLEPATNPNHRAFFHSFVFGGFLCFVGVKLWKDIQVRKNERKLLGIERISMSEVLDIILIVIISSILLHLLMDGFTKKGLPFI